MASADTVELLDIDGVETFADAEEKNSDHDESDQDRECDADFDHERHALGAGRREYEAVFEGHEADDLADRIAARHHHEQAEKQDGQGKGEIFARQGVRGSRGGKHDDEGQSDQTNAQQHGHADAADDLDIAVDAQTHHDALKTERNDHGLEE